MEMSVSMGTVGNAEQSEQARRNYKRGGNIAEKQATPSYGKHWVPGAEFYIVV